jgi:tyrosinase
MDSHQLFRRKFLTKSMYAAALTTLPGKTAFSQSTVPTRQSWQTFKLTPQYRSFVEAFRLMRNNVNPDDPNSLTYWANIHVNACPHKTHYFLAWQRG